MMENKDPDLCQDEGCEHAGTPHVCISVKFNPWRSMDSAPKDRLIKVFAHDPNTYGIWDYSDPSNPYREEHGDIISDLMCDCRWHPDAGFCICELRIPILWREIE